MRTSGWLAAPGAQRAAGIGLGLAGALGVRLGGPTVYPYGLSSRPWQGDGRDPDAADVVRAAWLSRNVSVAAAAVSAVLALGGLASGRAA